MTIVAEGDARPLVDALGAFARRFDIEVIEPTVLSISSNVVIHLRPAPVVARVANITAVGRDRPDRALEREIVLADHLLDEGVPTIEPSDLLPPGPHELDGRWASFFTYEKLTPVGDEDAERVGHACVDLLAATASYVDGDGLFDRSLRDEADVLLGRLVGRVAELDLSLLRAGADAAFVATDGSVQPIHADAHRGNVGRRPTGEIVWFDLDDAVMDSPLVDLATLARSWPDAGRTACERHGVDVDSDVIDALMSQREMWGGMWRQLYGLEFRGAHAERASDFLDRLRRLGSDG